MLLRDIAGEHFELFDTSGPACESVVEPQSRNLPMFEPHVHWLRGGLPDSVKAESDVDSLAWRLQMLAALLDRNYCDWGVTQAFDLQGILRWVANRNSCELDDTKCPMVTPRELRMALRLFDQLGITRRLPNFPAGSDESLGEMQKIYLRDSGLLHAVLGIETLEQLQRHSSVGDSWESYAIEEMIRAAADFATPQFFRKWNDDGKWDEIDLVLDAQLHNGRIIAIECKTNQKDNPEAGFYRGCEFIGATDSFVVHSGGDKIVDGKVDKLDLSTAVRTIQNVLSAV
ncbi:DUF4143 domain-containing protein [Hyphomonas sp.]|uniref:DUF4143 domain-containing protein n=1 Tax=Hyphomonas sp. TaxID=87 RepID=UPI00352949B2